MKAKAIGRLRHWLAFSALTLVAIVVIGALQGKVRETEITVYKSPTCGCCKKWIDHLEDNGFLVDAVDLKDISSIRDSKGVPEEVYACHTAIADGYVVEGHVPAADVKQMLAERPSIRGLAVPGMPVGSPGMERGYAEPYDVLALNSDGSTKVYARH